MPVHNDADHVAADEAPRSSALRRMFSAIRWRRSSHPKSHSELATAALGITLGLVCALFPWYVFYNPDQFGIRAMKFTGQNKLATGPSGLSTLPDKVGLPMSADVQLPLDPFSTGSLPFPMRDKEATAAALVDQPFPAETAPFRVIHATLGRAMIEDDGGLYVVQPGSVLPDNSRVEAIEQRDGGWIVMTSNDAVLTVEP